jgi:hypothetical protein
VRYGSIIQTKYDYYWIIYINKYMKCKCNNIIPSGRVKLGFSVCVQCSDVEAYGCAPLINHKTGNSIQIMSSSDAARIAKLTRRRGYGTMLA